jgi:hypothetical protein
LTVTVTLIRPGSALGEREPARFVSDDGPRRARRAAQHLRLQFRRQPGHIAAHAITPAGLRHQAALPAVE